MPTSKNSAACTSGKRPVAPFMLSLLTGLLVALYAAACVPIRPEPQSVASPTPTATTPPITATVLVNSLNLRAGPSTAHKWLDNARQHTVLIVTGKTSDCSWLLVSNPAGVEGWISGEEHLVTISTACARIPTVAADLIPTPPPTHTPTATATATATPTPQPTATALPATLESDASEADSPTPDAAAEESATASDAATAPTATTMLEVTATRTTAPATAADTAQDPTPTATATPTASPTAAPSPVAASTADATLAASHDSSAEGAATDAVKIPEGEGCVRILNYVGPELTVSFTSRATGEATTSRIASNESHLFCLPPALYTVTADAPPPFDSVDFELEITLGEGFELPLVAR